MLAKIFEWKIDTAFLEVGADVLPKICELQRGAGVVGKLLALRITVPAEIEDQMSNRIRRVAAIAEQIFEGLITGDGLVLAKGTEQIGELVLGNIKFADRSMMCETLCFAQANSPWRFDDVNWTDRNNTHQRCRGERGGR